MLRPLPTTPRARKSALALAAALALGAAPTQQVLAASCTWNPATGNWNVAANWSCGIVPTGGPDDATIGAAKVVTINTAQSVRNLTNSGGVNIDAFLLTLSGAGSTINTGTINIGAGPIPNNAALQVSAGHNINNTGGVINISADSVLNQFGSTISGGTINSTGTGRLVAFASASNFLSGVTLNGLLDMATAAGFERVINGLTLGGTISINNNSVLTFEGTNTVSGAGTIVLGNTGGSNRIGLDGNGTTTFAAGTTIRGENGTIGNAVFVGGTQTLVNNGVISADVVGGTINITGFAVTNNGTLSALNGGTLLLSSNVTGGATGQIVAGAGSTVMQNGVTLSGTINTGGGGRFAATASGSNFLDGVTLNGNLDLATSQGLERVTAGGLVLNGTISLNNNSVLAFNDTGGLSGAGTIVLGNTGGNNRIALDGNGITTFAAGTTIRGENGTIGNAVFVGGTQTLVNNGTISADVSGGTINITGSAVTNNGTLSALNGGTLLLSSNVSGGATGQIVAGAGSTVMQNGVTLSGTINTGGGGRFAATASGSNFLDGVTLNGNLDLATATGFERVTAGGLVLNGTISLNNNSVLAFNDTGGLSGAGTIVLGNTGGSNRIALDGNGTTTFAAGTTIRGENGTIGSHVFVGGTQTLVNNGTLSADVSGGTINITDSVVTNNGTLSALNGGTLLLSSDVTGGASGQIVAGAGSTVFQNAVTLSGVINTSGGGRFAATASGSNFLDAVTLNGNLDLATATGFERVTADGLVLNGTISLNNNSVLAFNDTGGLSGAGTIVLGNTGSSNRIALDGNGTTTFAAGTTIRGQNGTIGNAVFAGGTQTLVNNGTVHADTAGGLISFADSALVNNGLLRASAGTLGVGVALTGNGTLQVDSAGVMNLANGAKTQGTLAMGAAGATLNLGTGNLILNNDYTNTGAGSGNSFARRTGITGAGLVIAGGNAAQAISGAQVTNGNTANATLTIGNVRVGNTAFNYQVGNSGSTGPTLRGALQTNVNGANLNDPRLSGPGVTASSYNAGAPGGNSGNQVVNFNAASAGLLPALSGQVLNLRSNFENIADQKLNIVLTAGAAAFNAAVGNTTPSPVVVANQRVGGSNSAALTVANTAAAGAFSEDLNVSFGANTGAAGQNGGSISGLLAGSNNSALMSVNVNTASAGAKTGTVTLDYQTAGTVNGVSNGLGTASAGSQVLTVSGDVYRLAVGAATPSPINFGNVHVGGAAQQLLTVANTAANDSFSERLNAGFTGSTGSATTSAGSIAALAAGSSNNSSMGVTLNTASAGAKSGSVTLGFVSTGAGTSGLADIAAGSQVLNFSGNVYRLALANTVAPVNFGNVLANSVQTRTLTIRNDASADGFSEALNAAFGSLGGANAASFSTAGAIAVLLAGNSNNTTMVVTLDTSVTGAKTANVQVLLNSNGDAIGNGLGLTALPTQVINLDGLINANVGNLASAGLAPSNVNFGKFREGAANQVQQLTITNLTQGLGEGLNASFGASSGGAVHNGGSIASLATGGSNNTSLSVSLSGLATAGAKSGTQVLNFASDGSFNNGNVTALPAQNVNLSAEVYRLASASVNTPINLAARRIGDAAANATLTISNSAANDGFSEGLRGTIGAAPAGFAVSGAANTALIAAGANEQRTVSLSTATAGNLGGNVTVGMVSNGAGTSGFGDLTLADKLVALAGKVYTAAVGALASASVDFGVVRVGDTVAPRSVTVNNTAATTALNDTLTATLSGAASPFSAGGPASGIAAQGSGQIAVGLTTATAGVYNVNANMAFLSRNADMADASAGADAGVNLLATINNLANADFDFLSGLGVLTQSGSDYVLDLGNITLGASISSLLRIDNDVAGPADVLGGAFDLSSVNDFSLTGWSPVSGLNAGDHVDTLALSYLANSLGAYEDSIVFNGLGSNASDPAGLAQTRRLIIRANVVDPNGQPVPEPGSLALLLAAAVAGLIVRRRRAH